MGAAAAIAAESAVMVELAKLLPAEWNANRVTPATMRKIRTSIERYGFVENLVARPHPTERRRFEVLSGNHRLRLAGEMGFERLPVVLVDVDDAEARLLAQALNRTRGADDPVKYARLLEEVLGSLTTEVVAGVLPETENSLERALAAIRPPEAELDALQKPPAKPKSRRGGGLRVGPASAALR